MMTTDKELVKKYFDGEYEIVDDPYLGYEIHIFAYIGILLFNIPMSITLTILENTLSKKIACAVGLNTLFLFIGFLICFIDITINNIIIQKE